MNMKNETAEENAARTECIAPNGECPNTTGDCHGCRYAKPIENPIMTEARELLESCDREEAKARELRNELKAMVKRIDNVTKRVQAVCKEVEV